jgi:hypothetical protein
MKSLIAAALVLTVTGSAFAAPSAGPTSANVAMPRIVPSSVVRPTSLPSNFSGALIRVEFSLNQFGEPRDIRVLTNTTTEVRHQLLKAFSQWRFESDRFSRDEQRRYVLPVQLNAKA